jgi:SpoVK/Ycf46/Vps4 family AAA+-type ATPase
MFKRRFYFPCPNYSTRLKLFQVFFGGKGVELPASFPLSSLAHITEGFSAGNVTIQIIYIKKIKHALEKVLTVQRLKMVK